MHMRLVRKARSASTNRQSLALALPAHVCSLCPAHSKQLCRITPAKPRSRALFRCYRNMVTPGAKGCLKTSSDPTDTALATAQYSSCMAVHRLKQPELRLHRSRWTPRARASTPPWPPPKPAAWPVRLQAAPRGPAPLKLPARLRPHTAARPAAAAQARPPWCL